MADVFAFPPGAVVTLHGFITDARGSTLNVPPYQSEADTVCGTVWRWCWLCAARSKQASAS